MQRASNFPAGPELYCITDARLSGLSHQEQVAQMIAGGARIVQLRDKEMTDADFDITARDCQKLCRAAGAIFVVNDRAEIAAAISADGLHLGQDDFSPIAARRIVGNEMVVGTSTHNREQFLRALQEPVDYIAVGPVFGT
ncbi:MAG: thiamine phosphate synthase, partial [Candidatus Sumerlaeota bacterium]